MTKHYFTITRQLIAVALLALALAVQAQTGTQNTVTNPQLEQRLTERLEWIKTHYPERYAKMDEHELEMLREHELHMLRHEEPELFNPALRQAQGSIHEPETTNNKHKTTNNKQQTQNNKQRSSDNSRVSASDSLALVALFNATGGPNWYRKTNWLTGRVNTWYGITVIAGAVVQINLGWNNLSGTLPVEIGNLDNLQKLELSGNQLAGNIPTEIGNLSNLQYLYLYDNQLTGSIPAEIGNLSNLQGLYLYSNQLTGSIPAEIGNLNNLRNLYLNNNLLTGSIPAEIGNLSNLQYLYLYNNQLTGSIPAQIGNLSNLRYLYLHNNQLTGSIPAEIGNLSNLSLLYLYSNQLTGTIPESISKLTNLNQLLLQRNNFTSMLPLSIAGFRNLSTLSVDSNNFTKSDCGILQYIAARCPSCSITHSPQNSGFDFGVSCQSLQAPSGVQATLQGGGNILVTWTAPTQPGVLGYHVYRNMQRISSGLVTQTSYTDHVTDADIARYYVIAEYAAGTSMPGVMPNDLVLNQPMYDALVDLYNTTNGANWNNKANWFTDSISTWHGLTFNDGKLIRVTLNSNNLVGTIPASIGNLSNLQTLYLNNNQLTGSIPAEIGDMSSLQTLYLNSNQLTGSIPAEIGNLSNLQELNLRSNQLNGSIPAEIGNLSNLQELNLRSNQLTGSIPAEIGNLSNLQRLYLYSNQLSGSIPAEIGNLSNLQYLYLYSNQLTGSIPAQIGNLSNLQNLGLYYNQLTGSIPAQIGNLSNLQNLGLNSNQLTGSIPAEIGNLSNLSYLRLNNNQLTGSIPESFCSFDYLYEFYFYDNYFDLGSCPAVQCLVNHRVNMWSGSQLNGYNLLNDCPINVPVDIGVEEDWICNDGTPYYFGDATATSYNTIMWYTWGDGYFDDPYTLNPTYYPSMYDYWYGGIEIVVRVTGDYGWAEDAMYLYFDECVSSGIEIGVEEDWICADGSGYYFGNVLTSGDVYSFYWYSGGDGYFDDPYYLYPTYYPGTNDYQNGYVGIYVEAYGNDYYSDYMALYITAPPEVYAGADATINAGQSFTLTGAYVSNYDNLSWSSSGNGTFSSSSAMNPVYTPGFSDLLNGYAELCLMVQAYPCSNISDCMVLTINNTGTPALAVNPPAVVQSLPPGQTGAQTVAVINNGDGSLYWSLEIGQEAKAVQIAQPAAAPAESEPEVLAEKGAREIPGPPMTDNAGGPDTFGYSWKDSNEPGGPAFNWIDISATGTPVTDLGDDSYQGPFPIDFSFPFYENSYSEFYISSNGYISFGSGYSSLSNTQIPNTSTPNNYIAWCWDDLYMRSFSSVYYKTSGDQLVIQFKDYGEFGYSDSYINAEVILYASGKIVIQYLNTANGFDTQGCTIGIENITGTDGLQVAFNQAYIQNNLAVEFKAIPTWLTASLYSGIIAPGNTQNIGLSFDATGLTPDVYTANITITSNDPNNPLVTIPVNLTVSEGGPTTDLLTLFPGWNLISLDVIPVTATPEAVFAPLITASNLEMVTGFQNQMGVFFDPIGLPFLNTLTQLNPGEGYWVKISVSKDKHPKGISDVRYPMSDIRNENPISNLQSETTPPFGENQITHQTSHIGHLRSKENLSRDPITLTVAGTSIPSGFTINLHSGWNLIAYWPQETTAPETAFEQLISANILEMVTCYEQGGKFYDPNGLPFLNTLTEIKNGFGYWVKLSADYNGFTYPGMGWNCGDLLVDPRDGQSYATVQIGDQCWMAENLNIGTRINGSSNQTNNGIIEKYCYNNSDAQCDTYGGLYQWNEMMGYTTTPGVKGICPEGWHLPTDAEWTALTTYVSSQPAYLCNSNTSYIAKALAAKTNWTTHTGTCTVGNNLNANNATNFTALPGGYRDPYGSFYHVSFGGLWWSSSLLDASNAWLRSLYYNSAQVYRYDDDKSNGFSVRCLKDETSPPTTYNLNLEVSPAGAGTVTGAGQYEAGEQVNITAEANPGWQFVNWTDDDGIVSEAPNFVYTMPAEDIILTANFGVLTPTWQPCLGMPTVTDIDGNVYNTVQIGNQCWMASNLNVTRNNAGNNITRYCFSNNALNCELYGGLYTWNDMMNGATSSGNNPSGVQGICPNGWHIPSDAEWTQLTDYLINTYVDITADNVGNKLKSCRQVNSPMGGDCNTSEHPRWDSYASTYGTNNFAFSALPGGDYIGGSFNYLGTFGFWWSATEHSSTHAWNRYMGYYYGLVGRLSNDKSFGWSVRCLRDEESPHTFNLNIETNPPGSGIATGAGQYQAGEQVNITATANPGWEFVNWTDDDGLVSEAANFVYTMPAEDVTLTENFVEEQVGFTCGDPLVDARDGQTYTTVQIGDQCWMKENLKFLPSVVGPGTGSNTVPYYYVYGYNGTNVSAAKATANYQTYGALYNWPASLNACPEGWHLPTDSEWTALTTYVSSQPAYRCNSNTSYIAKALAATTNWSNYSGTCEVGNNLSTNNLTGFTALPGGYRSSGGSFGNLSGHGYWWSSTEYSTSNAWNRDMNYGDADVGRYYNYKSYGFSVRCLKDN